MVGEIVVAGFNDKDRERTEEAHGGLRPGSSGAGVWIVVAAVLVTALLIILDEMAIYSGAQRSRQFAYDVLGGAVAGLLLYIYTRR